MDTPTCPHPFHDDPSATGEPYRVVAGDVVIGGYRCPACAFGTVGTARYTPVTKTCGLCGGDFEGAEEIAGECCDPCFAAGVDAYIAQLPAAEHQARLAAEEPS